MAISHSQCTVEWRTLAKIEAKCLESRDPNGQQSMEGQVKGHGQNAIVKQPQPKWQSQVVSSVQNAMGEHQVPRSKSAHYACDGGSWQSMQQNGIINEKEHPAGEHSTAGLHPQREWTALCRHCETDL
jgi:hypothetical protein